MRALRARWDAIRTTWRRRPGGGAGDGLAARGEDTEPAAPAGDGFLALLAPQVLREAQVQEAERRAGPPPHERRGKGARACEYEQLDALLPPPFSFFHGALAACSLTLSLQRRLQEVMEQFGDVVIAYGECCPSAERLGALRSRWDSAPSAEQLPRRPP